MSSRQSNLFSYLIGVVCERRVLCDRHILRGLLFILIIFALPAQSNSKKEHATVAVASNFIPVMKELIIYFERNSNYDIRVSYSASGKLYAQIVNGAPFDVFLSADQLKPKQLIAEKQALAEHRFTYAIGQLVLWSANADLLDNTPQALLESRFRKLALANPKFAPYGMAALDVLSHLDIHEQTKAKWVQGESISQTYQFIATGNADLGFISFSQKPTTGSYWEIPANFYQAIRQDAVLLKKGEQNEAAVAFFEFLKSNEAKNIIQSHHYKVD